MQKTHMFSVSAKDNPVVAKYINAVRKGERSQYITYTNDGLRSVKRGSATRPSRVFKKKKEALSYAKKVATNNNANAFLFPRNGEDVVRV